MQSKTTLQHWSQIAHDGNGGYDTQQFYVRSAGRWAPPTIIHTTDGGVTSCGQPPIFLLACFASQISPVRFAHQRSLYNPRCCCDEVRINNFRGRWFPRLMKTRDWD
jgi:hypothetical protein